MSPFRSRGLFPTPVAFATGVGSVVPAFALQVHLHLVACEEDSAAFSFASPRGAATQDGMVTHPHATHDADECLRETHQATATATDAKS